jgi:hypothetical protein
VLVTSSAAEAAEAAEAAAAAVNLFLFCSIFLSC